MATQQHEAERDARMRERLAMMVKAAVHLGDAEGRQHVTVQAGLIYDAQHVALSAVQAAQSDAKQHYSAASESMHRAQARLDELAAFVAVHDAESSAMNFTQWRAQDVIQLMLFGGFMLLCMGLSVVNVQVNIMASQEVIFIESPWKAWVIALLAPAASTAIKMSPKMVEKLPWQERCKHVIYGVTAVVALLWVWQFSQTFDGLGGAVDIAAMLDTQSGGAHFVFVQLLCEVLISASLFLAVQSLLDSYAPERIKPNPARAIAEEQCRLCKSAHDKALKAYQESENQLCTHEAARGAFINEQLAAFGVAMARHHALFNV